MSSMSSPPHPPTTSLTPWTTKRIAVLTTDGRLLHGTLSGHDHLQNLILQNTIERVYSSDKPVELVDLGVYIVRGDCVVLVSEVDEVFDGKRELEGERADPIKAVVHTAL